MAKLKLDLHDIYNKGKLIDIELDNIIEEADEEEDVPIRGGEENVSEAIEDDEVSTGSIMNH